MILKKSVVPEGKGFLLNYIFEGPSKYLQILDLLQSIFTQISQDNVVVRIYL